MAQNSYKENTKFEGSKLICWVGNSKSGRSNHFLSLFSDKYFHLSEKMPMCSCCDWPRPAILSQFTVSQVVCASVEKMNNLVRVLVNVRMSGKMRLHMRWFTLTVGCCRAYDIISAGWCATISETVNWLIHLLYVLIQRWRAKVHNRTTII